MKLSNLILCLAFGLVFSACGMRFMSHNEKIQRYVGSSIEQVFAEWGAPGSSTVLPSGGTVYGFVTETERTEKTQEIRTNSNRRGSYGSSAGNETIEVYSKVKDVCKITMMADKKGIITSAHSDGAGCQGTWVKDNS